MTTFKQLAISMMVENGVWEDTAEKIFAAIVADKANEAMQGRWNDDISDYPAQMEIITRMVVNTHVLKWSDENCPLAWFRPMFGGA